MTQSQYQQVFEETGIPTNRAKIYSNLFVSNNIDFSVLDELDHDTLKSIGIEAVGDRIKILKKLNLHELCTHQTEESLQHHYAEPIQR